MKKENKNKNAIGFSPYAVGLIPFLIILSLPFFQQNFHFFSQKPLHGALIDSSVTSLSFKGWIGQSWQVAKRMEFYRDLGFRPDLVRLRSQLDYSAFNSPANTVIVGSKGQLYARGNYEAAIGMNFIGDSLVQNQMMRIKTIQNELSKLNKTLLTVITPNKLRTSPENLPKKYAIPVTVSGGQTAEKFPSNYNRFVHWAVKFEVDLVDFNPIFTAWKEKAEYPLFPNTGYHWSDFGALIACDQLIREMGTRTGQTFPNIRVSGIESSTLGRTTDKDLAELLNLIYTPALQPVGIPAVLPPLFPSDQPSGNTENRPRVLVISDSFWWKVYDQGIQRDYFAPGSEFWYYCSEAYSPEWEGPKPIQDFDILAAIEKVDYVLLMANEGNLHELGWGFVDGLGKALLAVKAEQTTKY